MRMEVKGHKVKLWEVKGPDGTIPLKVIHPDMEVKGQLGVKVTDWEVKIMGQAGVKVTDWEVKVRGQIETGTMTIIHEVVHQTDLAMRTEVLMHIHILEV